MRVQGSLASQIQTKVVRDFAERAEAPPTAEEMTGLLVSQAGRVSSYAGGYWRAIFEGLGDMAHDDPRMAGRKVERVLDPNAQHCKTCPPKAGVYDNWDAMANMVGIPADGSDQCFANCRCYVKMETAPGSGKFERM